MRTFILELDHTVTSEARSLSFSGYDAASAFTLLQRERSGCRGEVWEAGHKLATVSLDGDGIWHIGSRPMLRAA